MKYQLRYGLDIEFNSPILQLSALNLNNVTFYSYNSIDVDNLNIIISNPNGIATFKNCNF